MNIEDITKKREGLMTNYNSLIDKRVELEKQLEVTNNEILTMRGAILLCNELVEDQKVKDEYWKNMENKIETMETVKGAIDIYEKNCTIMF